EFSQYLATVFKKRGKMQIIVSWRINDSSRIFNFFCNFLKTAVTAIEISFTLVSKFY
ncbi:hypothetical protein C2G38_2062083, partial [Gigaspora rosea]